MEKIKNLENKEKMETVQINDKELEEVSGGRKIEKPSNESDKSVKFAGNSSGR